MRTPKKRQTLTEVREKIAVEQTVEEQLKDTREEILSILKVKDQNIRDENASRLGKTRPK